MLPVLALLAMTYAHPEQLVETDWVAAHAADANVRIVDMRQSGYAEGHVPGAVYVSPVAIRDAKAPPTFLPTPAAFEAMMARLGISDATRVVVYDERGGLYAARLWWILNYYGHTNVALMNGGWIKWTAEQRPATTETPAPSAGPFHGAAAAALDRHRQRRRRRHRQAGREDRRRAHAGRDRRQGSAQHQARRLRALVDSGLLGGAARPAAEDVQVGRRAQADLRRAAGSCRRRR